MKSQKETEMETEAEIASRRQEFMRYLESKVERMTVVYAARVYYKDMRSEKFVLYSEVDDGAFGTDMTEACAAFLCAPFHASTSTRSTECELIVPIDSLVGHRRTGKELAIYIWEITAYIILAFFAVMIATVLNPRIAPASWMKR
jgi:hypothetical protein